MSVSWPSPLSLAASRVLLGCALAMNSLEVSAILLKIDSGRLKVPGVMELPLSPTLILMWTMCSVVASVLIILGAVTHVAAVAVALLSVIALVWDQQTFSNHLWLSTVLVTIMAFAVSDAQWSLRSALLGQRHEVPAGPSLLMVTQLSVCYVFAGLSKINPWWLAGDELTHTLRIDVPPAGYPLLAGLVIVTEVFIGCGMWFRLTRVWALTAGVLLHASIVALMIEPLTLVGFSLACLAVYPLALAAPYADLRKLRPRIEHRNRFRQVPLNTAQK